MQKNPVEDLAQMYSDLNLQNHSGCYMEKGLGWTRTSVEAGPTITALKLFWTKVTFGDERVGDFRISFAGGAEEPEDGTNGKKNQRQLLRFGLRKWVESYANYWNGEATGLGEEEMESKSSELLCQVRDDYYTPEWNFK